MNIQIQKEPLFCAVCASTLCLATHSSSKHNMHRPFGRMKTVRIVTVTPYQGYVFIIEIENIPKKPNKLIVGRIVAMEVIVFHQPLWSFWTFLTAVNVPQCHSAPIERHKRYLVSDRKPLILNVLLPYFSAPVIFSHFFTVHAPVVYRFLHHFL